MFNGIIQTILVTFKHAHHVHQSSRARGTDLSLQTSTWLTRNMNVKVAIELYYIFRYRYPFTDAEYINSPVCRNFSAWLRLCCSILLPFGPLFVSPIVCVRLC